MGGSRIPAFLLLLLTCLPERPAAAQESPQPADPRQPALAAGRKALAAGNPEQARQHFLNALWHRPFATDVLALLLETDASDPDRKTLWAHALWAAGANDRGEFVPARDLRSLLPEDDPFLDRLARTRAAAVAELAALSSKTDRARGSRGHGNRLVVRYLGLLIRLIAAPAPVLVSRYGGAPGDEPPRDAYLPVTAALRRLLTDGLGARDSTQAILAALCLRGLATQAGFKDLEGPEAPDLKKLREEADRALAVAREQLRKEQGDPLSIEQLDLMSPEERLQFTRDHASFAWPGVALSRTGRYRIETICGFETLLGAAETVELHHARLVDFFGRDPFENRQGIVRIMPEADGLEAEGAPFWWAGGFQSGDLTVLRFNAGTIAGLGRGLTHELTHRFDGAVYPGLPSWLLEGRAVFTGAAYGAMWETSFIPNHASYGTIEQTMRKGYGQIANLTRLIEGEVDDYRDNYVAGYALYVYLNTWEEDGARLFSGALERFMKDAANGRRRPLAWFEECFCDGREGRPRTLAEFAERFATFISGFYWLDRKDWVDQRYTQQRNPDEPGWVYDSPTWQFSRNRAEPWFGQGQAARAGELLLGYDRRGDAATALVWAFDLDEWSAARAEALADLLERLGEERPAWVLRNETRLRSPALGLPHPGRSPLLPALPRLRDHLEALAEAAGFYRAAGRPLAAAAFAADHDRLADRLALERLAAPADLGRARLVAPFEPAPHCAGHLGWQEDGLTGYEEYRVPDLWYDTGDGDLHVGRQRPRDQTGQIDRAAHMRHAFARGREWLQPGRYRLTARIHFTTSFVSGAVLLGYTRRDRNVRLGFSAGDFMYSIGQSEEAARLDSVALTLRGIRDGEDAARGQVVHRKVEFDDPATSFALELLVDGAQVVAFVNDELIGSYHTVDGQPVEGYVGFAASFGAFRVEAPTIETLDRQRTAGVTDPDLAGLRLDAGALVSPRSLLNRPVAGVPPSPTGSLLVWVPGPAPEDLEYLETEEELEFERRRPALIGARAARHVADLLWRDCCCSRLVVALPDTLGDGGLGYFREELDRDPPVECVVVCHTAATSLTEKDGKAIVTEMPVLLFIDPVGVLRGMSPYMPGAPTLPSELEYWLAIHRGRAGSPR